MRFKKLRILLAVALIVFILFVGNVLVFGKLLNEVKTNKNEYTNTDIANTYTPTTSDKPSISTNKTTTNTSPSKTQTTTKTTTTKTPIVVTRRISRAS